jgi:lysophospholipase L1-like esterase
MGSILESGPRLPRSARRQLLRLGAFVPVVVFALLASVNWCSPDGAPPQPIDAFLLSLRSLDSTHARKVRILHFGDSHIASDNETSVVRTYLQDRFGDAGPGLWLPWGGPRLSSTAIAYGNTYGWQRSHPSYSSPVDDTGLSLSYIEAESPSQSVWMEAYGSEFRVDYLAQPGGGDAEFLLDGAPLGQRRMTSSYAQVQTATFQAPGSDGLHRFEIRTLDSGLVRILGVSVEKSTAGVVYSSLGLVGARAEYLLKCREETFEAQIAAEQPDLIILGYGTNETSGSFLDRNAYEAALIAIISRIRRAAPTALVVLLTPADRGDVHPWQEQRIQRILQEVIVAEREVAWREGAVLIDLHTAMGGAGSAEHWAAMRPPLARPDMIHFTNEGYNLLGRYIAGGIMKLYDSGPDTQSPTSISAFAGQERPGEVLPPLYSSGLTGGAILASRSHPGFASEPASAQIYYFLQSDGQVVITNDLSTVESTQGRVISAEQARCLLHGKTRPCDHAARW